MRGLRLAIVFPVAALVGCTESSAPPDPPRPPVAFVGDWVRLTPARLLGDTLRLRADSSAQGIILWDDKHDAVARRWVWRYGSRDPVASRVDWRNGYQDGGDADCSFGRTTVGCISMPIICLGVPGQMSCTALKYVAPDSLFLADGSSFVRARAPRGPATRSAI